MCRAFWHSVATSKRSAFIGFNERMSSVNRPEPSSSDTFRGSSALPAARLLVWLRVAFQPPFSSVYEVSVETWVPLVIRFCSGVATSIAMSVPRLYEKMYARVMENALSGGALKRRIFFWARGVADRFLRQPVVDIGRDLDLAGLRARRQQFGDVLDHA